LVRGSATERGVPPRVEGKQRDFPLAQIKQAGYGAVRRGERSWNDVAILAKDAEPVLTRATLPGDASDRQARYVEAAVKGVLIGCLYLPNGNQRPAPKFTYKLAWFKRLIVHAADLLAAKVPVALMGDFNVVPTDTDIYNTPSWRRNALLQLAPRTAFQHLLDQRWIDAIRTVHPEDPIYTFWAYKREAWPWDADLRLDHLLLSPGLVQCLEDAGVDRNNRGREGERIGRASVVITAYFGKEPLWIANT
jgi:exodeoxyribonuclease-3